MSTTESTDKTELTPNDRRWPECITSVVTSVEVEEVDEYGSFESETNRWKFGALPAGISARKRPNGKFEIKVFQDRDAYESNTAPAFRVDVDRISLQGCFIDLPEELANTSTGQLHLRNIEDFSIRYSDEYGYTAWVSMENQNPKDVNW